MKIQLRTMVVALPPRSAMSPSPSALQCLYTVDVHPSRTALFEDYLKRLVVSAERSGAPQRWRSYQVLAGGPTSRYIVELPFEKHVEKETWLHPAQALGRAFGLREGLRMHREASSAIERATSSELRFAPEFSARASARLARYQLLRLSRVRLEKSFAYERFLEKLAVAEEAAGGPETSRRVTTRGALGLYTTSIPFDRAAELDAWPDAGTALSDGYGREEARRLLELAVECTESCEELELCLRADLSRPKPEAAAR